MSNPRAPRAYTIRLFADLLKVPKHRRGQCVHELLDGMERQEELAMQKREPASFAAVQWIDDGRGETAHEFAGGNSIAVGGLSIGDR